jgi:hypothetical protein
MDSCATGNTPEICWFCKKGRHDDCMKEIPTQGKSDGMDHMIVLLIQNSIHANVSTKQLITNTALFEKFHDLQ